MFTVYCRNEQLVTKYLYTKNGFNLYKQDCDTFFKYDFLDYFS